MVEQVIEWPGASGTRYRYWVHAIGTTFKSAPGNYIFAREAQGRWFACYIGQTDNLGERLADHEKETCARRNGATHIHAHTSGGEMERRVEEADLIKAHAPPCNTLLK